MSDFNSTPAKKPAMAPKAVAALIIGINGCLAGLAYGIPGIILGAIGLSLAAKAQTALYLNPDIYRGEKIVRLAKKWSMIALVQGIILGVLYTLYFGVIIGAVIYSIYQ